MAARTHREGLREGRRKKEEGRRKKEEGRRKKEEGRRKKNPPLPPPRGEIQEEGHTSTTLSVRCLMPDVPFPMPHSRCPIPDVHALSCTDIATNLYALKGRGSLRQLIT
ncbi:hypothetical protein [Microcoleus sp.]|uniref:hypothetical protein n=1 Tax=Microcoleus sp. TaxID=44472 RepID=UPI003526C2FB